MGKHWNAAIETQVDKAVDKVMKNQKGPIYTMTPPSIYVEELIRRGWHMEPATRSRKVLMSFDPALRARV